MASSAPLAAKARIANAGANALDGSVMGGSSQGNAGAVQYAQAVPPSWNASGRVVLLDVRQQVEKVGAKHPVTGRRIIPDDGRQMPKRVMVIVRGQAKLLHVVGALDPAGGLADLLDGGQQQADQHGDDGNDDQQL